MSDDLIERIWREAPEEPTVPREVLLAELEPGLARGTLLLHAYVWGYLGIQAAILFLAGRNLLVYRGNATMLAVQVGLALLALGTGAHGVYLFGEVRRVERMDAPLATTLRRRLALYGAHARTWTWLAAVSLASLGFVFEAGIDAVDGRYPVHRPLFFASLLVLQVLVLAGSFRIAHGPVLDELRAALADLEAQVLEHTTAARARRARWRLWYLALLVVLTTLLVLGAWMFWRPLG